MGNGVNHILHVACLIIINKLDSLLGVDKHGAQGLGSVDVEHGLFQGRYSPHIAKVACFGLTVQSRNVTIALRCNIAPLALIPP